MSGFSFQQDGLRSGGIEVRPTELDVGTKEHEPSRGELEAAWRERLDHTLTCRRPRWAATGKEVIVKCPDQK
jgi:hypothetical protein